MDAMKIMMESVLDKRLAESENLILEEVGRTRKILDDKINKVQANLEEINQYYRITRLENDNTELSKRVEELEKKTA